MHLTHQSGTGKSEIRISKLETNSNDQNIKPYHKIAFDFNFEHLDFDIVSDFGIRIYYKQYIVQIQY